MGEVSCRLTIFEGPDGAGKTTAAKLYAEATKARYVHFPALPMVTRGLGRLYVEAMLPAILGFQPVVLDRCWLSEQPYGIAFRDGKDRLGAATCWMLERLALRCGAVVIKCRPAWETVQANYQARRATEMLKDERQLKLVYDLYTAQRTDLPEIHYDYTAMSHVDRTAQFARLFARTTSHRPWCHPIELASAGNWSAPILLVGEKFTHRRDHDAWYQWPFSSFSQVGCSRWFTEQLHEAGISEHNLLWCNADQLAQASPSIISEILTNRHVVALGRAAAETVAYLLDVRGILTRPILLAQHPQAHKRSHSARPYPIIRQIKEILDAVV